MAMLMHGGVNYSGSTGDDVVTLTQAEYDSLTIEEQMDPTKVYYITDGVFTDSIIVPNPESSATDELTKLQIDSTVYSLAGGTEVEANPIDPATDILSKINIDGTVYGIEGGGTSAVSLPSIYSNTEKVVGLWTDNKPLYQKTLIYAGPYSGTSSSVSIGVPNLDTVFIVDGFALDVNDSIHTVPYVHTNTVNLGGVFISSDKTSIGLRLGSGITWHDLHIVIQYTKTTDQPVSNFDLSMFGIFSPVIYSTDEREIGVWIDNKPLYEKTIFKTYDSTMKGTEYQWDHGIENIDQCVSAEGYFQRNGGIQGNRAQPTSISSGSANYNGNLSVMLFNFDRTKTMWHLGNTWSQSEYLPDCLVAILRYTKTTDIAGSGSFTTSGVPAIHYDDTEKVIGTWFGETLYEKTVYCGNLTNNSTKNVEHNISNVREIVNFSGYANTGTNYVPLPFVSTIATNCVLIDAGSTNIDITTANNRTSWVAYVTLQYTKATS